MNETQTRRIIDTHAVLALLLTIFAWASLLSPYYFDAHDSQQSLFFTVEFFQGIAGGYFYPRWGPDFGFGHGYPVFIFYPPLSLYITQAFRLVGFGVVGAVKAAYITAFLVGAAGTYRLTRTWFSRQAALVASLAYTYLPYHLVDVYVRAAVAESWALALFPWTLLAAIRLIRRPTARRVGAFALTYGALILMHSPTALLFTPLIGVFMLLQLWWKWRDEGVGPVLRTSLMTAGSIALGIWITVGYLVPNLVEQQYIPLEQWVGGNYQFDKQFVFPGQFLTSTWGFGYAVEGANDGMSFQLGIVGVGVAVAALWYVLRGTFDRRRTVVVTVSVGTLLLVLLAMSPASAPFWNVLPLARFVQFPWRFLAPAIALLALLSGAAVHGLARETGYRTDSRLGPGTLLVAGIILLASYSYTVPQFTPQSDRQETPLTLFDMEYEHPDMVAYLATTPEQPTESPLIAQYEAGETPQKLRLANGAGSVTQTSYAGSSMEADVQAETPVTVEVITFYYPGWRAWVDDQPAEIEPAGEHGHMTVAVPAGSHHVTLRFTDTPLRRYATFASVLGVLVAVGLIAGSNRRELLNRRR